MVFRFEKSNTFSAAYEETCNKRDDKVTCARGTGITGRVWRDRMRDSILFGLTTVGIVCLVCVEITYIPVAGTLLHQSRRTSLHT